MKVKVAAIQMSADIGGRETNVERAERLLIQAARQGANLCVLPELALDEFFPLLRTPATLPTRRSWTGQPSGAFVPWRGSWGSTWPFRCLKRV